MIKWLNKFVEKYGLYCLAVGIVILNVSLAFDNVVWGDEAFSGTIIRGTNLQGIFERIFYWDSHPPLYYYWLRFMAEIFGYKTSVYHFVTLVPFVAGIIVAVTLFKNTFGKIPTAFFVVLSGFAAPCVEYNLEIRMYSLVFFEILICTFCSYKIIKYGNIRRYWILLTLFGVLAAYTHYYGLIISGILIFVTGVFDFLRRRSVLYGLSSIVVYLLVYSPWLYVFFQQAQREDNMWLKEIAPLNVLTNMIFCGENLKGILAVVTIVCTLIIIVKESELLYFELEPGKDIITWKLQKPSVKNWSVELQGILQFWICIVLTVIFTYVVSIVLTPMTVARYMYPLVPLLLFILMLCIRRILAYGHVEWGDEDYGYVNEPKREKQVFLVDTKSVSWKRIVLALVSVLFIIVLIVSMFDFKYYRSVSKTQEVQTQKVLSIIGEPNNEAVFTAMGVQHLSWTVLPYYYPENEVQGCLPNEVDPEVNEIWAFMGYAMSDEAIADMEAKGYSMEVHMDLWMGKYGCNLYHFYR